MNTYTIKNVVRQGKECFLIVDQNNIYTGWRRDTKEGAQELINFWKSQGPGFYVEYSQDDIEYSPEMYGNDDDYNQGSGNSEEDEDKTFGL